jgi:hypothetical protein
VVVLLSDFLADGWERPLRELAVRNEVIAITVDDPHDRDPPTTGWVEVEDAETGLRSIVNSADASARKRWRAAAEARQLSRAERITAAGAEHIALDVATDYGLILRRAFAKRAGRRGARRR